MRQFDDAGHKVYTLNDLYPHADLVSFPSLYEGFGNAFIEAVYFKIPVLMNRYLVFARDIEPKRFRLPVLDGFVDRQVVEEVRRVLHDPEYRSELVEHNYAVANRYYSYSVLRYLLQTLLTNIEKQV